MAFVKTRKDRKLFAGTAKKSSAGQEELFSMIQQRAYGLYEKRGLANGNDLGDWFEAERQVRKELR